MIPGVNHPGNGGVIPGLTPGDLERFQQRLLARESELRRSISQSDRAAPDTELNSAHLERDLHELREIDAALERIIAGTFGCCLRCGKPMERARLELFPAARFDICCMEYEEAEHETAALKPHA
jgi:RNA polymerase-binding transcription factor DksA